MSEENLDAQQNDTGGQEDVNNATAEQESQQEQTGQETGGTLLGSQQEQQAETTEQAAGQAAEKQQETVTYADFRLPAGAQIDEAILGDFKTLAAECGMSQEAAQKMLDLQAKANQQAFDVVIKQRQDWRQSITNDPEFGGANLEQTVKDARSLLNKHDASGNVLAMLEQSGFGDNPDVIKFLARVQRAMPKEDDVLTGKEGAKDTRPLAERLWPN